jgi:hypothetical protein
MSGSGVMAGGRSAILGYLGKNFSVSRHTRDFQLAEAYQQKRH